MISKGSRLNAPFISDLGKLGRQLKGRIFPWRAEIAALRSQFACYEQVYEDRFRVLSEQLVALERLCEDRFRAASEHRFVLEELLTSSPSARLPGAEEAVAKLGEPAVSIIMPTFNRAPFIAEAIRSVQAQSFRAWELIVVDDGSSDSTEEVVNNFRSDCRVRYIRQEHSGASKARKRGVEETLAPIIAYIDSDNTWYKNFLLSAVDHLAVNIEDDVVYGALVTYIHGLEDKCILWRRFDRRELLERNFIDANVLVHRRELVFRFGNWDEKLKRLSDWDLILRYTVEKPAHALNVLAAYYRKCDEMRISDSQPHDDAVEMVRSKWIK